MNLKELVENWGPVTVLLIAIVVIATIIGGVVVIVQPETLNFSEYLSKLQAFVLALAGLGIGRGVMIGAQSHGKAVGEARVAAAKVQAQATTPSSPVGGP